MSKRKRKEDDTLSPFIQKAVENNFGFTSIIKQSLEEHLTEYVSVVLEKPEHDNFLLLIKDNKATVLLFDSIIFNFCILDKSPGNLTIATSHADSTILITTFKREIWKIENTLGYINGDNNYDKNLDKNVILQNLKNNGISSIIDLQDFLKEAEKYVSSSSTTKSTTSTPSSSSSSTSSTASTLILNEPFELLAYNASRNVICALSSYKNDPITIVGIDDDEVTARTLVFWDLNSKYLENKEFELMQYLHRDVYQDDFMNIWENIDILDIQSCKNHFIVSINVNNRGSFILFIKFLDDENNLGSFNVVYRENINMNIDAEFIMKYSILESNNEEIILCKTIQGVFILKITNFEYKKIRQIFVPLDINSIYHDIDNYPKFDVCLDTNTHENLIFVVNEDRNIVIKLFKRNRPSCVFSFSFCNNIFSHSLISSGSIEKLDIQTDISKSDSIYKTKKFFISLIYKNEGDVNIRGIVFSCFLDDLSRALRPDEIIIDKRPSYKIISSTEHLYLHKISTFLKKPDIIAPKPESSRDLSSDFKKIRKDGKNKRKSIKKSKKKSKKSNKSKKSKKSKKKSKKKSNKKNQRNNIIKKKNVI